MKLIALPFALTKALNLLSSLTFQVFLSATPDHWCHIDELSNLTVEEQKALSIPVRNMGKSIEYERCFQYNVNFSKIWAENNNAWPKQADSNWPKTKCKDGWDYDRREFKDTLVTEVRQRFFIHFRHCTVFQKHTLLDGPRI